jgi:hypothetical protein
MPFSPLWTTRLEETSILAVEVPGQNRTLRINLDDFLGVSEGKFVWNGTGFVSKAVPNSIRLNGSVLCANLLNGTLMVPATVDLSTNVIVNTITGSIECRGVSYSYGSYR